MPQDRPNSIEAFCDQLLAGLGSVREGRRSLEQMVGELSDDEQELDGIEPSHYEDDAIEVDPALGWAGTRWSHARDYTMRIISALTCGTFSFLLMQTAGVAALPGLVIAAIAIGAAAGLAPQIGSAISAVGFLALMANATMPTSMKDFERCIRGIHEYAPTVKVTGAISNISFDMPARKYVNMNCMAYAIAAGLDSAIMDPCNMDMIGTIYACEALTMKDKGGRKFNRAYRQGRFGVKK